MNTDKIKNALDACFGLMMQPTEVNYDGYGKKWIIPDDFEGRFNKARAKAEKMYYEAIQPPQPLEYNKDIDLVQELVAIRNKLYDELPTGKIKAWDLISIIKWHINDLDNFTSKLHSVLNHKP